MRRLYAISDGFPWNVQSPSFGKKVTNNTERPLFSIWNEHFWKTCLHLDASCCTCATLSDSWQQMSSIRNIVVGHIGGVVTRLSALFDMENARTMVFMYRHLGEGCWSPARREQLGV